MAADEVVGAGGRCGRRERNAELRTLVFLGLADTDDHAYLFTVMVSLEPYVFECETRRVPPEPAERRPVFPHLP